MKKLLITIAILSAASLCGCADSGESAVSSESSASTTSAAAAQSTSATTAATTSATTTATTAATTTAPTTAATTTAETTASEAVSDIPTTPEPTTPEAETTPDGKYTLAETDLVNEDGTYTQDLSSVDSIAVPDFLSDKDPSIFISRGRTANPSKIPYSEITLENAAEAFPYLGFIGYVPDYLEILPTDGEAQIRVKVMQNMSGTPTIYCTGYSEALYPGHCFSSESEYNAYVKQQEAERAAADAAAAKAREDSEAGRFGFDGSPEDTDALLDYIESLGL